MKYHLVRCPIGAGQVTMKLAEGWKLYGSPVWDSGDGCFYQPMIEGMKDPWRKG